MPTRGDILIHAPLHPPLTGFKVTKPDCSPPLPPSAGTRPTDLPTLGGRKVHSSDYMEKGEHKKQGCSRNPNGQECYQGHGQLSAEQAYLCWCSTSSSRLLPSRLLAPLPCRPGLWAGSWKALRPPRVARLEEGWHTWRASPLILFRPRNPLVLAFFLSCCRKAFRPGERQVKMAYDPPSPAQDQQPKAG